MAEVTHSYTGAKPITIYWAAANNCTYTIQAKKPWKERERLKNPLSGPKPGLSRIELSPGQKIVDLVFLHHDWHIPSGAADIVFSWNVLVPDTPMARSFRPLCIAKASATLDVAPSTIAQVRRLSQEIARRAGSGTTRDCADAYETLWGCAHEDFFWLALRILESDPNGVNDRAIDHMVSTAPEPVVVEKWLSYLERKSDSKAMAAIFFQWYRERPALNKAQEVRLLSIDNLWIKTLAFLTFPDLYSPERKAELFSRLRRAPLPLASTEFDTLLTSLADQDPAVHREAFNKLASVAFESRLAIQQALDGELPMKTRAALEALEKTPSLNHRETLSFRIVHVLGLWRNPEARDVLETLSKSRTAWIAQEATRVLDVMLRTSPRPKSRGAS